MREYVELWHMSLAKTPSVYVIPHHGIWLGTLEKRKLRVVFDASCPASPASDGRRLSLNDILLCGPKLQPDIVDVFIQFRMHAVALTTDLVKMYGQVLLHPEQRPMQYILWREDPSLPLRTYELNTVTYGLKPSAHLTICSVKQLLNDEGKHFPLAASKIAEAIYVDDFVSRAETEEEARQLREELIVLFAKGGIGLGMWSSNMPSIIPRNEVTSTPLSLSETNDHSMKILGMVWNPVCDTFSYRAVQPEFVTTKRMLLSSIARIYDPLGLLASVIFTAKCLLQDIWKAGLDWNAVLPKELCDRWRALAHVWKHLSSIVVPRHITFTVRRRMLVGFCDASQRGSAAVVYSRSESPTGETRVHLINAKSKLSPTRYVSIARLELCGALLLARMISSLRVPKCDLSTTICCTDSMFALSWLRTPTYKLKTYKANRVSSILEKNQHDGLVSHAFGRQPCRPSLERLWPMCSKGLKHVVEWSYLASQTAERRPLGDPCAPDTHANEAANAFTLAIQQVKGTSLIDWISRFSSLPRLVRTVARILRFLRRTEIKSTSITASEYDEALIKCVLISQINYIPSIFLRGEVPEAYRSLSPFIGEDGIVRVGGRLKVATIAFNHKHPMLIPRDCHLSRLINEDIHSHIFHAGPTLTLSLILNRFWIPGGLRFVKGSIMRCVRCRILKAKSMHPVMGSLPKERFTQFKAFSQTGVDYAGPLLIRSTKRRTSPRTNPLSHEKAYVCLFICLASRAMHLECVSSQTTESFLAALDRFVPRRGDPQVIHSDNGSNFIGASNYLKDVFQFLIKNEADIVNRLTPQRITWKLIPPRAPHFGGSWEAGVKSMKTLLSLSVGKQPFTFEELSTILTRIEGILNSRPLCPLSADVDSCEFLTPGHFLAGAPHQIPEAVENHVASARTRWAIVKKQVEQVWERWKTEYLHCLQQRGKWLQDSINPNIGDLVILLEKRGVVGEWPIARICELHPGSDSKVRVVSVRCPSGTVLKRAVRTLAPLFHPESKGDIDAKENSCI